MLDYRFFALKKLREQQKEIEAYDGYSKEDMLDNFIKETGYHPIEQYQLLKYKLMDDFLSSEDKDILRKVKFLGFDEAVDLAKGFNLSNKTYSEDSILNKQISNFLVDIFWEKDNYDT